MRKYRMLRQRLSLEAGFEFEPAPLATREEVEMAHSPEYVSSFLAGTLSAEAIRRIGFPWSQGLVRRTLASVGGTIAAARRAMQTGWGGTLAGGTHHAFFDYGSGYCVFNDIAVAIRGLTTRGAIARAAVVDLDVHQGDGTAALFSGDDAVLTVSVHGRNNFPFRKQVSNVDVELPDDAGDSDLFAVLDGVLARVWEFQPDVVFYQSGVDGLEEDKLGRLSLTLDGLRRRDEWVLGDCRQHGVPVVVTLGGGYADPIERTVEAHAATFLVSRQIWS
ncbi:MAG: histone deacetylase [Bryobacteraceae bacterium]